MIQRGIATFGLDWGKCPPWLFERMVRLGREMTRAIVAEEGPDEFIRRLADPAWFQALGTVLAFDWNASGLTTILTAALKEAIRREEIDLGIFICGGKGKTSRKTPDEIFNWGQRMNFAPSKTENLIYNSKMAAKVDSALVQDGFQIYHHAFFFTRNGAWTVVQQGMNAVNQTARRYHWHSPKTQTNTDQTRTNADNSPTNLDDTPTNAELPRASASSQRNSAFSFVCEPHSAIVSQIFTNNVLDLTAQTSTKNRDISTELVATQGFNTLMKDLIVLSKHITPVSKMVEVSDKTGQQRLKFLNLETVEFRSHPVVTENFAKSKYLQKILWRLCDQKPENYEKLLAKEGVGPKTIRALALVAEVLYGAKPSYEDPARYSFAHGGKDGTPYPVDRATYDQTIATMREYVKKSKISPLEKQKSLDKLDKNRLPF